MTEGTTFYCGDNCNHTGPHRYPPSVTALLWDLHHVHDWRMVGQLADARVVLVCPHHDPPETRTVSP